MRRHHTQLSPRQNNVSNNSNSWNGLLLFQHIPHRSGLSYDILLLVSSRRSLLSHIIPGGPLDLLPTQLGGPNNLSIFFQFSQRILDPGSASPLRVILNNRHVLQNPFKSFNIFDLGEQIVGEANILKVGFLVLPPDVGRVGNMVAYAWNYFGAFLFRSDDESPVVSADSQLSRCPLHTLHLARIPYLRSSLLETPLGYRATYRRGFPEGI